MNWQPIVGERQCGWCHQVKPATAFSPKRQRNGEIVPHTYCKACRCDRAKLAQAAGRRKDRPKPGRMGEKSPGAWKWPRDERPVCDRSLDKLLGQLARAGIGAGT